jgi:hypothetical protein
MCSFARLMLQAAEHGLLDLACHAFEDTLHNTLEFIVFLRATDDKHAVVESWRRMEMAVNQAVLGPQGMAEDAVAALSIALTAARAEASAYANSTSWKITAPLRKIVQFIRMSEGLSR